MATRSTRRYKPRFYVTPSLRQMPEVVNKLFSWTNHSGSTTILGTGGLGTGLGIVGLGSFYANNPLDPGHSQTATTPVGWSTYAAAYERYAVLSSKLTLQIHRNRCFFYKDGGGTTHSPFKDAALNQAVNYYPGSPHIAIPLIFSVVRSETAVFAAPTSPTTQPGKAFEYLPGSNSVTLAADQESATLSITFNARQDGRVADLVDNDDFFGDTDLSTYPMRTFFYTLFCHTPMQSGGALPDQYVSISARMDMVIRFTDTFT